MQNINRVVITGHLTRDPELKTLESGTALCQLRIACNGRRKDPSTNEWGDRPDFFDVTVWGGQGKSVAEHLTKGSGIAIDGRLEWREWDVADDTKRQAVAIVADNVQFLGGAKSAEQPGASEPESGEDIPS
jgi:single-strand DNA-binding protein